MHKFSFDAIGTAWLIETRSPLADTTKNAIERLVETFDKTYSRFRDDSLVRHIAETAPGTYKFPESIIEIYQFYEALYNATDGKVTPLIGGSLESIGYDKDYSLTPKAYAKAPLWRDALQLERQTLHVKQAVTLDIGAAGKGYLVDQVTKILIRAEVGSFVVDASGDIYSHNASQRIGLENPYDTTKVLGIATIDNGALCASAINRRQWANGLHHVLDSTTGKPTDSVIATWVMADSALHADGIATALFFAPPDALQQLLPKFSYAVLQKNGTMLYSKDTNWEIFT